MVNESSTLLLSFVVPCYNVERYLQRCLDSIYLCGLPEKQFEVVCVNDCSPDGLEEILESNQIRHSNLRIIKHKQNKGPGGARNTGIKEARGQYLWFVDPDDEIMGDGVTDALKYACTEDLDVLCFNYRKLDANGEEIPLQYLIKDTLPKNGSDFAKTVFEGGISLNLGYVVRFLYKLEYLRQHGLYFPENVCWEDTVYMPKSIIEADKVAAISSVLYIYWANDDSYCGTFSRVYPARLIYEFVFCTGVDLLHFSEQIDDAELRQEIFDAAVNRYINRFPLLLFRTGKEEREKFFEMVKGHCEDIASIKCYINKIGRAFLMPIIGPMLATVLSFLYKKTHHV